MHLNKLTAPPEVLIGDLLSNGAVSLPLIPPNFVEALLEEARSYQYEQLPKEYGDFDTRQEMAVYHVSDRKSLLWCLAEQLQERIASKILRQLFSGRLKFNEVEMLRYPEGSVGIAPHLDQKRYVNLICSCNLTGGGRFFTCGDREGNNPVEHRAEAGDVILLRGHDFAGEKKRPFHYVSSLQSERFTCIIRQNKSA